ncbi:MAG TPA: ATP synthase F0 subunit B [Clostridiales bacterium]|nr:ATP synthase F0 subunit B [Clostridiales bacterium]
MFTAEAMAGYASTAILTLVNLLVTYLVLKRFLFKPILNVLRKRKAEVENELTQAESKLQQADGKLSDAVKRLENSNHEAAVIMSDARSQADIQSEAILADAKREAAGMLTRADSEINRLKVSMLNDVRDEVADLSVAIASKVIGQVMDERRQHEMVEHLMNEQMETRESKETGAIKRGES